MLKCYFYSLIIYHSVFFLRRRITSFSSSRRGEREREYARQIRGGEEEKTKKKKTTKRNRITQIIMDTHKDDEEKERTRCCQCHLRKGRTDVMLRTSSLSRHVYELPFSSSLCRTTVFHEHVILMRAEEKGKENNGRRSHTRVSLLVTDDSDRYSIIYYSDRS